MTRWKSDIFLNPRIMAPAAMVCAAALRFWSINFGLPFTEARPDESAIIGISIQLLGDRLVPASLVYPTFFSYLLSAVYAAYAVISGGRADIYHFLISRYAENPAFFFLSARVLGALAGVATIPVCYLIARELADAQAGIYSAFFAAFCYLHARDSHFGVLDVPLTLFIALSAFYALRSLRTKTVRDYLLSGLFAGLAAGTKYVGVLMAFHILAAHLINRSDKKKPFLSAARDLRPWAFAAGLIGVFFITTPFAFLDFRKTLEYYRYHRQLHGFLTGGSWLYHLKFSLYEGLGGPLAACAAGGLALLARDDWRKFAGLSVFPAVYFAVLARTNSAFVRYAVPLLPFLCAAAGYFAWRAARLLEGRPYRTAVLLIPVCIIGPSAARIADFDLILGRKDNRALAAQALSASLDCQSGIYQAGTVYTELPFEWNADYLDRAAASAAAQNSRFRAELYKARRKLLAKSGGCGHEKISYDPDSSVFSDSSGKPAEPDYIVLPYQPFNSKIPKGLAGILQDRYTQIAQFEAFAPDQTRNSYDVHDAFFVPFSGFCGVSRPGPDIYVFRKIK
ncbi:MAG: glycosyltransferase family 39 protein [Elusimicrobiales bacterium]|nr:glycosyltransferase family 39 protein [Elusimicrobiales bacterium]